jgi:hypothetical protein
MKTRPICEVVAYDLLTDLLRTRDHCICRWPEYDQKGGAQKGFWWVEVDAKGIAYTGYTPYTEMPF